MTKEQKQIARRYVAFTLAMFPPDMRKSFRISALRKGISHVRGLPPIESMKGC